MGINMTELVKWDQAKKAIAAAYNVDEIKLIRDKAEAYRYALKLADEAPAVIRQAEEIKLRAERRAGEILKETTLQKPGEYKRSQATTVSPKLSDIGVSKDQSSNWQRIASIPEAAFEQYIASTPEITTAGAVKLARKIEYEKDMQLKNKEIEGPEGLYNVIVIDPPWPVHKIERDVRPNQIDLDYPVMTIDEIINLDIPAADNCHIFLWTTQKYLPYAIDILKKWDMKYILTFVWHKPGGFQPVGLPQYNSEFCIYARKGTPKFIDTKSFFTCFAANRKKHSEKPIEFYSTIKRVTSPPRLDMFARKKIDGFVPWGNEI